MNLDEMSAPNKNPAPLRLSLKPSFSSGSDQSKSQIPPLCGTSTFLSTSLISSRLSKLGLNPP